MHCILQDARQGELGNTRGILGKIASALLFIISFGQASVKNDSIKKLTEVNSSLRQVSFFSNLQVDTDNSSTAVADNHIAPKD
ncbi:hypothetical protein ACD661_09820 [Legionella lytica]|uniref:Uncharacterized protein n=1 Tax=Legionella lytica TaxID=96232 RepID=A0ABW8D818_9GAMM